jgi:hypothetical protein
LTFHAPLSSPKPTATINETKEIVVSNRGIQKILSVINKYAF